MQLKMGSYKPCTHPHSPTPTHTQAEKGHTHPYPAIKRNSLTPTHTQSQKGHNHPDPPTPSQEKITSPTPTQNQPKKGHTNPHAPTLTHIHPMKGHIHLHLAIKGIYPPKFSRKCNEKKIFHYPLGNQICQKLKKSSMPIDQWTSIP